MKDTSGGSATQIRLRDYLRDELILPQRELTAQQELFRFVNEVALENGYVNEQFLPKLIAREEKYPTGLELEQGAVAIPHTDADTIVKEFVAVITTKEPIEFHRMDDPAHLVRPRLFFVLGLNRPHAQVKMLQQLAAVIQNHELVTLLEQAPTPEAIRATLE
ncbi:PTS system, galactitol-specific IIA component [Propionibacterium cyclohexanicum]|uniref:PTS system, galactitol-specific IIA component n=1 Tax=Propionibacterium cyclohexanicum TaxID=64702 RepID=A0A1H9TR88_9ACTN|nr:PTS sugar transporter subunit IIA [Propionibacterium cyclohexanicum]SER99183.1 PTS system, galactitol-specific IIA component [Propionibacterium cyclohexanicum]